MRRLIHVSALGARRRAEQYLRSKARGEAALRASGLDVTVLRPSVIFGERDRFLNLFASLQSLFPVMPLAGAEARFQPVWVEDVAAGIVRCLDDRSSIGLTIECVRPARVHPARAGRPAGDWSGSRRPVLALPGALGRLQALAMELLPGRTLMSRDNLDSMKVASVGTGKLPGLDRLGIETTPLDSIAPRYLGHVFGEARLEAWRARARRG